MSRADLTIHSAAEALEGARTRHVTTHALRRRRRSRVPLPRTSLRQPVLRARDAKRGRQPAGRRAFRRPAERDDRTPAPSTEPPSVARGKREPFSSSSTVPSDGAGPASGGMSREVTSVRETAQALVPRHSVSPSMRFNEHNTLVADTIVKGGDEGHFSTAYGLFNERRIDEALALIRGRRMADVANGAVRRAMTPLQVLVDAVRSRQSDRRARPLRSTCRRCRRGGRTTCRDAGWDTPRRPPRRVPPVRLRRAVRAPNGRLRPTKPMPRPWG